MTAIGIAQWLVMVRQVPWAGWWLLGNAISGAVCGAVMLSVRAALLPIAGETVASITGVVTGLAMFGVVQWLILRRRISWAGRLALASVAGLLAAVVVAGLIGSLTEHELGSGGGFGAGYGAVTGAALIMLGRRTTSRSVEPSTI